MALAADIVEVVAPASAAAGDTVIVDVKVKNLGVTNNYIAVTGNYDSTWLPFQFDYLNVAPQETVVFRGAFTMPSRKVKVTLWSWYWDGRQWVLEATAHIDIDLQGNTLVPAFSDFKILDYKAVQEAL